MAVLPRILRHIKYEEAAEAYLRSLPLEHFMEATPQSKQREITLESLALVRAQRSDFHVFNELLVQYPLRPDDSKLEQVVPDNMVVLSEKPIKAIGSYDIPLQPAKPFWMLEYVSKASKRKDYDDNLIKYERDLKTPYYLHFYPDIQEMTLYKLRKGEYVSVKPNKKGRCAIPKVELEMAILDGWVRFWYQGELLPLPADLLQKLKDAERLAKDERRKRLAAEKELVKLKAEIERLRSK